MTVMACLAVDRVQKSFGGIKALDGASFSIEPGELVGLIGPNGSGKTTMLNILSGHLAPDAGEVALDERPVAGMRPEVLARLGVMRMFQLTRIFPRMSALDNLMVAGCALGLKQDEAARRAGALLVDLALSRFAHLDAGHLSGGQMKLLELSRGLMGEPKMLLLDEPTAGVAPKLARTIFEQIAELRQTLGLTFLVIEHRLEVLFDFVEDVYVMHAGRVIAHGPPAAIAADAHVREIYFGE